MRVVVDINKCIGAGNCLVAPDVFDQREDDGLVVVLQEHPPADRHHEVSEAAQLCPARAITIEEDPA
jgi:ferredoxin